MELINERIKELERILIELPLSIGTIERLVKMVRLIADMGIVEGRLEELRRSTMRKENIANG